MEVYKKNKNKNKNNPTTTTTLDKDKGEDVGEEEPLLKGWFELEVWS